LQGRKKETDGEEKKREKVTHPRRETDGRGPFSPRDRWEGKENRRDMNLTQGTGDVRL
jgi:hypothetical protein